MFNVKNDSNKPLKVSPDDAKLLELKKKLINRSIDPYKGMDKNTAILSSSGEDKINSRSEDIRNKVDGVTKMFELFPEMELNAQILINSVLSPKDMTSNEVYYQVDNFIFSNELTSSLLNVVEKELNKKFKIKERMQKLIRDVLIDKGSYSMAIVPDSEIDRVTGVKDNYSTESVILSSLYEGEGKNRTLKPMGFLSNGTEEISDKGYSPESFHTRDGKYDHYSSKVSYKFKDSTEEKTLPLEISDNYNILKFPDLKKRLRRNSISNEAIRNGSPTTIDISSLYRDNDGNVEYVQMLDSSEVDNVGRPVLIEIDSCAVMPVCPAGSPNDPIAVILLLDSNGSTVSQNYTVDSTMFNGLSNSGDGDGTTGNYLLNKAHSNLISNKNDNNAIFSDASGLYDKIIEDTINKRLANGLNDGELEVHRSEEAKRIMFYRALSNKFTRLLYVPIEMFSYITYKTYDNGLGKSLMDGLTTVNNLRAMLLFATTMGEISNNINIKEVNIELDPDSPDPEKDIEIISDLVLKTQQVLLPFGLNESVDFSHWLHKAGFMFTYSGHDGLPDLKLNYDQKTGDKHIPNTELMERMDNIVTMAFYLTPDMTSDVHSATLATSLVQENLLLAKRVQAIQDIIMPQVSDLGKKIMRFDGVIRTMLGDIISKEIVTVKDSLKDKLKKYGMDNKTDKELVKWFVSIFIEEVKITLPKPDTATISTLKEEFELYKGSIEDAIEAVVSEELINSENSGELEGKVEVFLNNYKSLKLREWMSKNNYLTELLDMFYDKDNTNKGITVTEELSTYTGKIIENIGEYLKGVNVPKKKSDNLIEKLDDEEVTGITGDGDMDVRSKI